MSSELGGSFLRDRRDGDDALHDDTNCAGVGDVTVAITGADGMRVELVTNGNGNFRLDHWPGTNLFPYNAEVSRNGVVGRC